MKRIALVVSLMVFTGIVVVGESNAATRNLVEGKDYEIMSPKGSKQREVLEFFSYACAACYTMENVVDDFKKKNPDIKVIPVPTDLGHSQWEVYVKAYYLGKMLKVLDQSHPKIFHMIHVQKKHLVSEDDLKKFFIGLGIEQAKIESALSSFTLNSSIRRGKQLMRSFRVSGTPTFVANKRYKLNNQSVPLKDIPQALADLTQLEK